MQSAGWNHNGGQALVLVMMVISVLFVLTASLGTITSLTKGNVIGEQHFTQAVYAADAGIEKAVAQIVTEVPTDPEWYTGLTDSTYTNILSGNLPGNVSFAVQAQKTARSLGTSLLLHSVGKCMDGSGQVMAQKTIRADVAVFTVADFFRGISILPENPLPLNTTGNMEVDVDGDFIINGSLDPGESIHITGKVYASGTIFGSYPGGKYSNYPYIPPFPKPDSAFYLDKATENGQTYYTDTTFANPQAGVATYEGFYFIDGDVDISGDYNGTAVFFATGDINITGDLIPRQNFGDDADTTVGNLTLIALGDITMDNCTVYTNLLSQSFIVVRGNVALYGAACVAGVDFGDEDLGSGNFTLHFDNDRPPQSDAIPIAVKIVDWQELYPVF